MSHSDQPDIPVGACTCEQDRTSVPAPAVGALSAAPRAKFTVSEFNLLRWYARTHFEARLDRREEFEKVHPPAARMADLLDVADIVLKVANELAAWREKLKRNEAQLAAKRRMARRKELGR